MSEKPDDSASKSEEPTDKKLQKARQKGDVPITKEAGHLLSYASLLVVVAVVLPLEGGRLAGELSDLFQTAPFARID